MVPGPFPPGYVPRLAEKSVLHEVVRENLETFLAEARERTEHGFGVPRFVDDELRAFLRCGVAAHGFARIQCGACGHEILVAFSCKRRGVCPSCSGRRAAECAAHLVDKVFPVVPVRQWVLTLPRRLRFALARESRLATTVLAIWHRSLSSFYRLSAKKEGFPATQTGAVTFVHRFASNLALNVHFHTVMPDGVFEVPAPDQQRAAFIGLPPPAHDDIERLLAMVVRRVTRCMARHFEGRTDDFAVGALDALAAKSLEGRRESVDARPAGRFEAFLDGFSLHTLGCSLRRKRRPAVQAAGTHLHENDRAGLERLCRYGARGPLALGRLTKDCDGKVRYRMKRTIGGRDELVMTGVELIEKLAVLIPPPRVNLVRFFGVFAPGSKLRALVVPEPPAAAGHGHDPPPPAAAPKPKQPFSRDGTSRIDWASLLKRVFAVDILACAKCNGRMKVLAVIEQAEVVEQILGHLGMSTVPEGIAPARRTPRQLDLDVA